MYALSSNNPFSGPREGDDYKELISKMGSSEKELMTSAAEREATRVMERQVSQT